MSDTYTCMAPVRRWSGDKASWYFAHLPVELSEDIRDLYPDLRAGFGSLKVEVTLGETTWQTSIFPDAASGRFVLPLKQAVRAAEGVDDGANLELTVRVRTEVS